MTIRKISECVNKHFFVGEDCLWCKERATDFHPFYEGDCVGCGALCGKDRYCCTDKDPMSEADFDLTLRVRGGFADVDLNRSR
jgi:D-arabinose 1-dehydrogenase-like Zn-dependent alcohol dehydrogenase